MRRKFGIEHSSGGMFPTTEGRYDDIPDIPDTWKNLDSFKFDRSIEKAENFQNGKEAKRFEDRSSDYPSGKPKVIKYTYLQILPSPNMNGLNSFHRFNSR